MTQLSASAFTMISKPVAEVRAALVDYHTVRPGLLTEDFADYRVEAGGNGAGTEVHWTQFVDERKPKSLSRLFGPGKRPRWRCRVLVETPDELRIVERDAEQPVVTTWRLTPSGDERCVVAVQTEWQAPDGLAGLRTRMRQKLALRKTYESVLTNLHNHFDPENPTD